MRKRKIYWGDSQTNDIRRSNLDGSNTEILISGQSTPRGIKIDVNGGHFYWMDGAANVLRRANLDGSNVTTIVSGLSVAIDLTLDLDKGFIYFTDNGDDRIYRSNLDGSNLQTILNNGDLTNPTGIALDSENDKNLLGRFYLKYHL